VTDIVNFFWFLSLIKIRCARNPLSILAELDAHNFAIALARRSQYLAA
jgi:hypothetical protein